MGYSYAVDLGIARTVREGLVRSVGVSTNPNTLRQNRSTSTASKHEGPGGDEAVMTCPGEVGRLALRITGGFHDGRS